MTTVTLFDTPFTYVRRRIPHDDPDLHMIALNVYEFSAYLRQKDTFNAIQTNKNSMVSMRDLQV